MIAGTCVAHGMVTGPPLAMTTTVRGLAALTARTSWSAFWGSLSETRSRSSVS